MRREADEPRNDDKESGQVISLDHSLGRNQICDISGEQVAAVEEKNKAEAKVSTEPKEQVIGMNKKGQCMARDVACRGDTVESDESATRTKRKLGGKNKRHEKWKQRRTPPSSCAAE
jgi:hypothetical protein